MLPDKSSAQTMSMPLAFTSVVLFDKRGCASATINAAKASQRNAAKNVPARERRTPVNPSPASPTNTKTPATNRAAPSATPATAAAAAAGKNMDGQRPFQIYELFTVDSFPLFFLRFRFLHRAHRRAVQLAQLRFARLVFGKLHQVAAREKIPEAFLLLLTSKSVLLNSRRNSSVVRSGTRN